MRQCDKAKRRKGDCAMGRLNENLVNGWSLSANIRFSIGISSPWPIKKAYWIDYLLFSFHSKNSVSLK